MVPYMSTQALNVNKAAVHMIVVGYILADISDDPIVCSRLLED